MEKDWKLTLAENVSLGIKGFLEKLHWPIIVIGGFLFLEPLITALAGKKTESDIDIKINFFPDIGSNSGWIIATCIFALLSLITTILYFRERKNKKKTIEQLAPFREIVENSIDPDRLSSELPKDGGSPK